MNHKSHQAFLITATIQNYRNPYAISLIQNPLVNFILILIHHFSYYCIVFIAIIANIIIIKRNIIIKGIILIIKSIIINIIKTNLIIILIIKSIINIIIINRIIIIACIAMNIEYFIY